MPVRGLLEICVPDDIALQRSFVPSFDTDQSANCDSMIALTTTTFGCVWFAPPNATIGSSIVTGSHPLVVASAGAITISGSIDLQNHAANASCVDANGGTAAGGAGGGGGGSFQLEGGTGGAGKGGIGATGGMTHGAVTTVTSVQFGCDGGNGGVAPSSPAAPGGASGGSLYLAARDRITVAASVLNASGFPGAGGAAATVGSVGGGAGGGTGGMIAFDSPIVTVTPGSLVLANGGGGGGGGGTEAGENGGRSTTRLTGRGGTPGPGGGTGGVGGDGESRGANGGMATLANDAGGGGGGAAGWILVYAQQVNFDQTMASPVPTRP